MQLSLFFCYIRGFQPESGIDVIETGPSNFQGLLGPINPIAALPNICVGLLTQVLPPGGNFGLSLVFREQ